MKLCGVMILALLKYWPRRNENNSAIILDNEFR